MIYARLCTGARVCTTTIRYPAKQGGTVSGLTAGNTLIVNHRHRRRNERYGTRTRIIMACIVNRPFRGPNKTQRRNSSHRPDCESNDSIIIPFVSSSTPSTWTNVIIGVPTETTKRRGTYVVWTFVSVCRMYDSVPATTRRTVESRNRITFYSRSNRRNYVGQFGGTEYDRKKRLLRCGLC